MSLNVIAEVLVYSVFWHEMPLSEYKQLFDNMPFMGLQDTCDVFQGHIFCAACTACLKLDA